jgi:subtilisin-like proprotein convertase family protein
MAQNSYTLLGAQVSVEAASSSNLNLSIPDKSAVGVTSTLSIENNLEIESIEITFSITHSATSDLGLELTSPAGTKSILVNINSGIIQTNFSNAHFITNAFLDELSQGSWTLKVIDGAQDDTGTLDSWAIKVNGRTDSLLNKKGDFITKSPLYSIFESFKDYFTNS